MASKKISKKQKSSKKSTAKVMKLKSFDPLKEFKELGPEELFDVLYDLWMERDIDSFKGVLETYLNTHNKQLIAKEMGVSRSTLYHMVSPEGNPTLDTLFSLMTAIEKTAA